MMDHWYGFALVLLLMAGPIVIASIRYRRWQDKRAKVGYVLALALSLATPFLGEYGWVALVPAYVAALWPRSKRTTGVVVTLAMLAALMVSISGGSAQALDCGSWQRSKSIETENFLGMRWGKITLAVCWSRQLVPCTNDPCWGIVKWKKNYVNGMYSLDHWHTDENGKGQYANGVKWKAKIIRGEFRGCAIVQSQQTCAHNILWVHIVIRTDGTSSVDAGWYNP